MTKKQIKLATLLVPAPLGKGLSWSEAAKELKISLSAFAQRVKTFKNKHSNIYNTILSMRRAMYLQQNNRIMLVSDWSKFENKIKERF